MMKMLQTHIKFFWTGFGRLLSYSSKTDVFCEKNNFQSISVCVKGVFSASLCDLAVGIWNYSDNMVYICFMLS